MKIGEPNDRFEQETDAVVTRIMSTSDAYALRLPPMEIEIMMPKLNIQPLEEEEKL